ncbi:hypothetical protein PRZ48_008963 [Zasmidium cellare]|uniref:Uncharacterized protein n=1 Tax=Zasmidium cellare TaxID=395010 RepID=A0ABR0EI13_ZASCE|nr:hypothetical protein PRZ48_008963 [Zasmidium cellare]
MPGIKRLDRRDPHSRSLESLPDCLYDENTSAGTTMSRRRARLVCRAIKHNESNRLLNLPAEIRNEIYSLVIGERKVLRQTYPSHCLPKNILDQALQPILEVSKQLRAEGLGFLYSHNPLFIDGDMYQWNRVQPQHRRGHDYYLKSLQSEDDAQAHIEPLGDILIPKIAFQASRRLEMRVDTRIFTQLACSWHAVGVVLVVHGDEYSCRVHFECCDKSDICQAMVESLVLDAREQLVEKYLDKMRDDDGTMARDMRLIVDERANSPRYYASTDRPYWKHGFYSDYPWQFPQ